MYEVVQVSLTIKNNSDNILLYIKNPYDSCIFRLINRKELLIKREVNLATARVLYDRNK